MKRIAFLPIALLLVSLTLTPSFAQKKTKEEKALEKEWKKKMKDLTPMQYKQLLDDQAALRTQTSELGNQVSNLQAEVNTKNSEIERLNTQVRDTEKKLADEQSSNVTKYGGKARADGVMFKVQIGAFRNKDLSKYLENSPNFSGDVDPDGTKKYTLGYFGDYWEADNFKKYLREMGVRDAWIVAYKNGQRVNIKDVLESGTSGQ